MDGIQPEAVRLVRPGFADGFVRCEAAQGLDLSQNMLNMARLNVAAAGVPNVTLRHGDIQATGLPDACADLVIIHQVLHYLTDPE